MQLVPFAGDDDYSKTRVLRSLCNRLATLHKLKLGPLALAIGLERTVDISPDSRHRLRHALHHRPHLRRPGPLPTLPRWPEHPMQARWTPLKQRLLGTLLTRAAAPSTMQAPPRPHGGTP